MDTKGGATKLVMRAGYGSGSESVGFYVKG